MTDGDQTTITKRGPSMAYLCEDMKVARLVEAPRVSIHATKASSCSTAWSETI